jgi:hypothetical protein
MAKKNNGTDRAAIRATGRRAAAARTQPVERRVTCTTCNGAGKVTA